MMGTRSVPAGPQTGRPGQDGEELIGLHARVANLEQQANHLGAVTTHDIPRTWAEALSGTRFHLLTGYRRPFIATYVAFSGDNPGTQDAVDTIRCGIYRMRREDLDKGDLTMRLSSKTPYFPEGGMGASYADYLGELERPVTINMSDLWFVAAHCNPDGATANLYATDQVGSRIPGAFYTAAQDLPDAITPSDGLVDLNEQYSVGNAARCMFHFQVLTSSAKRLTWPDF